MAPRLPIRSTRRALAGVLALAASIAVTSSPAHAEGAPIDGFGTDGVVLLPNSAIVPGGQRLERVSAFVDAAGRIVVGAAVVDGSSQPVGGVVLRLLAEGGLDSSFGSGGIVHLPGQVRAVAELLDGRLMAAGEDSWWRLGDGGALDATFTPPGLTDELWAMADGRLLDVSDLGVSLVDGDARPSPGLVASPPAVAGALGDVTPMHAAIDMSGRIHLGYTRLPAGDGDWTCHVETFDQQGNALGGELTLAFTQPVIGACDMAWAPDGSFHATRGLSGATGFEQLDVDAAGTTLRHTTLSPGAGAPAVDGSGRLLLPETEPFTGLASIRRFALDGAPDAGFGADGVVSLAGGGAMTITVAPQPSGGILGYGVTPTGIALAQLASLTGVAAEPPLVPTGRFVPLSPTRLLDTRTGLGAAPAKLGPGGTVRLPVAGRAGIPASGIAAVALNVTATEADGPGYVTVWPTGSPLPIVSNLNLERRAQTVANFVIAPVGGDGSVSLYTQNGAHLIADVAGWFEVVTSSTSGRFVPAPTPTRLLDTRDGTGAPATKPGRGGIVELQVTGAAPVPASGVSAVVLNVTAVDATAPGYVTVWPSGQSLPTASNLNLAAGDVRANLVIVPVGAGGRVSLYTQNGAHLLADVAGWFTDATAADGVDGLFVPIPPRRVLDTRAVPGRLLAGGEAIARLVGSTDVVPPGLAGAVVANLTATEAGGAGFVTAWPADVDRPLASNLNLMAAGQTVANLAIVGLGADTAGLYTHGRTHLIMDVAGWFVL